MLESLHGNCRIQIVLVIPRLCTRGHVVVKAVIRFVTVHEVNRISPLPENNDNSVFRNEYKVANNGNDGIKDFYKSV